MWLRHATEGKGRLVLDDGAVRAVSERRASLLPAGELIVIDGGHHLHMEQPERIAEVIGDFFVRDR